MTPDAGRFWDKEVIQPTHNSWMAPLRTRHYINELVSGRPGGWPLDWFQEWLGGRRFGKALSVGCGTGSLERDLLQRNICDAIDAFDGSAVSLEVARQEAKASGLADRVHYFIGDFNEPSLPASTYDAVFFHQSAHHVGKLEKLFRALLRTTKPGAVIYLDEFVGPSRTDWNYENLARWDAIYQTFPRKVRFFDKLPLPIQYDDLSEAARSAEILDQLKIGFDIRALRGYGGNVLSMMYPGLIPGEVTDEMVAKMIEMEKEWLQRGETSFNAIIVAERRDGAIQRAIANGRYFLEPKFKRIARDASRLFKR